MFRFCLHFVVALVLVSTAFVVSGRLHQASPVVMSSPVTSVVAVDPTLTQDEMALKTGDNFWGLNLGGVIPCSTMLVKGGGYLVLLAPSENQDARCFFHVKDSKQIDFYGRKFVLEVTGQDAVRVKREPTQVATTS